MEKKKGWDDIPSLDGLGIDWEYKSESASNKREFIRTKTKTLTNLFELKEIFVKIATASQTCTARLLDLGEGGLSLGVSMPLEVNLPIKVGFFLGQMKVIAKAEVRHVRKVEGQYIAGVKFVDLDKEAAQFIRELYASQIFRHPL